MHFQITAEEAKNMLVEGNSKYIQAQAGSGDISPEIRQKTCREGQHPYAVIITCSDSRVIPEEIFSAGIGKLFVIRVAGNVIDNHQLGSIEYAVSHLGCPLVLVLGHDHCGAVDAAIHQKPDGYIKFITDSILEAIGDEKDDLKACCLNVRHSSRMIRRSPLIQEEEKHGLKVLEAIYHLESGKVEFLEES